MEEDFVADSEDEGQLRLSASISPRRALESAFSRDITNNTDTPLPPAKSFAASIISQFTSTVASTGQDFDDSPIVQFSTAETRPSTSKAKKPKRLQEVIDLSDDDGDFSPIVNKSRRKKSNPVDAEPKPRKTKARASRSNRDSSPSGNYRGQSTDIEQVSSEPLEPIPITDESDIPEIKTGKAQKKKPTKARKKDKDTTFETIEISSAASERQDSPLPSKKRKAVDSESAKPTKRRKKTPPQEIDIDQEDKPKKGKGSRKGREKKPVLVEDDEDSAPDELLLASEDDSKVQSKSSRHARKPSSEASAIHSAKESPPPRSKSPEAEPPEEEVQAKESEPEPEPAQPPPPVAPKPKPNPRPSVVQQNPHVIPKRGSISSLLMKTGAYAPLSSSKLTKRVSSKIAPLHLDRKTPPPPLPTIPKPKKKAKEEEEEEEDFTGMTAKQIKQYMEEKKRKAWYSP